MLAARGCEEAGVRRGCEEAAGHGGSSITGKGSSEDLLGVVPENTKASPEEMGVVGSIEEVGAKVVSTVKKYVNH